MNYTTTCTTCGLSLALGLESYTPEEKPGVNYPGSPESGDVVIVEDESECSCSHLRQYLNNVYFRELLDHRLSAQGD